MSKKPAADLSGLVATKGSAAPVANMPSRTPAHAEDTAAECREQCSAEFPSAGRVPPPLSHVCSRP